MPLSAVSVTWKPWIVIQLLLLTVKPRSPPVTTTFAPVAAR